MSSSRFASQSRASLRKARQEAAEQEMALEERDAFLMTREQQRILEQSFLSVKCNLWPLDGQKWTASMKKRANTQPLIQLPENTLSSPARPPLPSSFLNAHAPKAKTSRKLTPYPSTNTAECFTVFPSESLITSQCALPPATPSFSAKDLADLQLPPVNYLDTLTVRQKPAAVLSRPLAVMSLFQTTSDESVTDLFSESAPNTTAIIFDSETADLPFTSSDSDVFSKNDPTSPSAGDTLAVDNVIARWDVHTVRKRRIPSSTSTVRATRARSRSIKSSRLVGNTAPFTTQTNALSAGRKSGLGLGLGLTSAEDMETVGLEMTV